MVQSIFVDRIGCGSCLSVHAGHGPNEAAGTARLRWIKFSHRRSVGHRSSRDFSSDASLNARAGELVDRLCCCIQSDDFASSELLVADRFRAGGILFRLHLATLCRKGKRSARHSRFLLRSCYGSSSLVRPGPHSNEAGGSRLRHAPTFMTRQNAILNDNRVRYNRKEALWPNKLNLRNQSIR